MSELTGGIVLNPDLPKRWVIDVCVPTIREDGTAGVQMKSWIVETKDPTEAIQKFIDEGSEEQYYEGEVVNNIIVGLQPAE